jgi:heme/copper-type cytochrome/quinol oxidase subunit 2
MDEGLTTLMTIIGPIILLVAIIWAISHNRSRVSKDTTERATEANYEAEDRAVKDEEGR